MKNITWYSKVAIGRAVSYAFLILVALTIVYPMLWMVSASLREQQLLFETLTSIVPPEVTLDNYVRVLTGTMFARAYLNSIIVTGVSVCGLLLITSMAAYSFGRLRWRGKEGVFRIILSGQLIAPVAIMIPAFVIIDAIGLISTYTGLILLYLARVPFGTFILRSFFEAIPREVEDAGVIDGCSPYQMYRLIMLPLARSSIAGIGIFYLFFVWNDFVYPLVILQRERLYTLPLEIFSLQGGMGDVAWDLQTAALTMAIIPAVIATALFYRWIVRGLTAGAIK